MIYANHDSKSLLLRNQHLKDYIQRWESFWFQFHSAFFLLLQNFRLGNILGSWEVNSVHMQRKFSLRKL